MTKDSPSDSDKQSGAPQTPKEVIIDHRDIARKWKLDYSFGIKDQTNRALDGIQKLLSRLQEPAINIPDLLLDAANVICQQFGIKEASIGLMNPADGIYRYEIIVGMREDAEKALKRIEYTVDDFGESSVWKGTAISEYTKLFLSDDKPYAKGEEDSYSRPALLGYIKRKSITESLEGDYLDVLVFGKKGEIVGWLEISGTKTGELPDIPTIRWMELISKIIGTAIILQNERSPPSGSGRPE